MIFTKNRYILDPVVWRNGQKADSATNINDVGNAVIDINECVANVRYKMDFLMRFFSKTIENIVVGDEPSRRFEVNRPLTDMEYYYLTQIIDNPTKDDIETIFVGKGTGIVVSVIIVTNDAIEGFNGVFRNGEKYVIVLHSEFNEETLAYLYFHLLDDLIQNCGILQQKIPPMCDVILYRTINAPIVLSAYYVIFFKIAKEHSMLEDLFEIYSSYVTDEIYTGFFLMARTAGEKLLNDVTRKDPDTEFIYSLATCIGKDLDFGTKVVPTAG